MGLAFFIIILAILSYQDYKMQKIHIVGISVLLITSVLIGQPSLKIFAVIGFLIFLEIILSTLILFYNYYIYNKTIELSFVNEADYILLLSIGFVLGLQGAVVVTTIAFMFISFYMIIKRINKAPLYPFVFVSFILFLISKKLLFFLSL